MAVHTLYSWIFKIYIMYTLSCICYLAKSLSVPVIEFMAADYACRKLDLRFFCANLAPHNKIQEELVVASLKKRWKRNRTFLCIRFVPPPSSTLLSFQRLFLTKLLLWWSKKSEFMIFSVISYMYSFIFHLRHYSVR